MEVLEDARLRVVEYMWILGNRSSSPKKSFMGKTSLDTSHVITRP